MSNLSVVIGADTSKFINEVKNAKAALDQFVAETQSASETASENASVSEEQVRAFEKVINKLQSVADGTKTVKQEQSALKRQIQELQGQWDSLSNDARASGFGQAMAETMRAAKEELASLKNDMANVDNVQLSGSVKKQLRQTSNELVSLTAQYRAMSAAEQQSAEGQALAQKMDELRAKAGELKDTIGDVSQEITVMASDTPNLDVFNDILGISGNLLSTYSSVLAKVTGDEKALKNAISTFMAVQSACNTVTNIANALQSSSALMLKVKKIQELAAAAAIRTKTAAETKGVVVTKAATIAQRIFNAVAAANPYVLLAMAIVGVTTALIGFSSSADKAADAQEDLNKKTDDATKAMEEHKRESDALGSKTGDLIGKFLVLQAEWKSLKTEAEQKAWIENNQSAFAALCVGVNDVNDAYRVFVEKAPEVIAALKAIAEAEAYKDLYKETIKKREQLKAEKPQPKLAKKEDYEGKAYGTTGGAFEDNPEWKKAGLKPGRKDIDISFKPFSFDDYVAPTEEGIKKINDYRVKEAQAAHDKELALVTDQADQYEKKMVGAIAEEVKAKGELAKLGGKPKPKGGGSSKKGGEIEPVSGSLSSLEKELADIKKKYRDGLLKIDPDEYIRQVETLETKIQNKKIELGLAPDYDSLSGLESQLSELKRKYKDGLLPNLSTEDYLKKVDELEKQIKDKKIEMGIEPKIDEGSLTYIDEQISKKQKDLKLAIDDKSRKKIQDEIDELTGQKTAIELKLKPVVDKSAIEDVDIRIKEHRETVSENKKNNVVNNAGADKVTKASNNLNEIKEELDFQKSIASSLQSQYDLIQKKIAAGGMLDENESRLASIYEDAAKAVDKLSVSYNKAADNARELKLNSELKKQTWEGVKSGINTIGNLNSAVKGTFDTWKSLGEQWNDMTPFEKTTAAIDATIQTISSAISAYEDISKMIEIFGTISELSAAKKVAANTTEMASDEALVATQTANTQVKIANDTAENTSEIGKLGVKQAGAIASATASGASLPFPANLAAIAAGIAAVVAAFAMVFSSFAEGGIVSGRNTIGDYNFARVNNGEMILNGSQQKRLFNMLNGTGSRNGYVVGGNNSVSFRIKGNNLYGVLKNHEKKFNRY